MPDLSDPELSSPDAALRRGVEHLRELFPQLDPVLVERTVFESYAALAKHATVRSHLPPLAENFARDRLHAITRRDGAGEPTIEVLFLSTRNDGISQIGAAFVNERGGGRIVARSAALNPATHVLRTVIDVMEEAGVPLADAYPKPLSDDIGRDADVIVTMLCEYPFPLRDGQVSEEWEFEDPAGLGTSEVRNLRDRILRKADEFVAAHVVADRA